MTNLTHHFIKWGGFLCEICTLPMLYSATLLDPFPFDAARISAIGLTAAVSCACAYFSSSRFKDSADTKSLGPIKIISKPPFVVWLTVVVIIALQLTNGLVMMYLVNKR